MSRRKLGRDRHVKTESGDKPGKNWENRDFGYCDHGWRLQTSDEAHVYDMLKGEGWTVHKHGWPDFVAVRGEEVRFIEVKSSSDTKRQSQLDVHKAFQKRGVRVEVLIVDNPNRKPRKYFTHKPIPLKVHKEGT